MLAVLLALGASIGWGASDFLGGWKSRTLPLLPVLLISQATALAVLVVVAAVRGAGPPDAASLAYAGVAGVAEGLAVAALYRGLAIGVMSIVAPVASVAPALPLVVDLAGGEVPGPVQGVGLALAVVGVGISSQRREPAGGGVSRSTLRASVLYGLLAAGGFGVFFVTLDRASDADVGFALLGARLTAVVLLAALAAVRRARLAVPRADLPVLALTGLLIVAADSMYAFATSVGSLGVVAVVSATHPVVTMGLARVVLTERLQTIQRLGILATLAGVLTLAAT